MAPLNAWLIGLVSLVTLTAPAASAAAAHHGGLSQRDASSSGGQKPIDSRTAQEVVARLNLTANPEKGYYAETFRDTALVAGNRSASTAIYYLLEGSAGDSLWHRVDAAEVWHYYAGAPLVLSLSHNDGTPTRRLTLGPDVFRCQQPQVVIGEWEWQSARSLGNWTLVGTTVAPAFDPNQYEIAAADWTPNSG